MITDESQMKMIKLIIEIPDEVFEIRNEIENGSPIANLVMIALKFAKPYEERPKGEWIEVGDNQPYSKDKLYGCSECRFGGYLLSDTKSVNFCPNCGAEMSEGDKNEE